MNSVYKITQLKTNVWAIEDVASNENSISYLLCGTNKALLFDTGLGLSPIFPVLGNITKLPIVACLSHWHFDHSGGAHEFDELFGWKSEAMQTASQKGVPDKTIHSEVGQGFWQSIGSNHFQTEPFPQATLIDDEISFDIGGLTLQVLHTPGHTKDSICLYEPNQNWLFAGDTAYPGRIYLQFEDSSWEDYQKTLQRLANYKITVIFPGHNALIASSTLLGELAKVTQDAGYRSSEYPRIGVVYES